MAGSAFRDTPRALDLTILILCRDEENSVAGCVGEARGFLARNAIPGEVVVVDNASGDRSAERARAAGARVVAEPRAGYGNAIAAGVRAARGRFVILGDGDGEHDLDALEPLWEKLGEGFEVVIGNRFAGPRAADAAPSALRRFGNLALSQLGKRLFDAPVGDFHCGLRGFEGAAARVLAPRSPGMEAASEMIARAVGRNMRIAEAPVALRRAADPARSSHLRPWRDGWRHLRLLLILCPRWLFLRPGLALLAVGLAVAAAPALFPAEEGGPLGGYTMLFGAAGTICGAQLIGFHYLAQAYCESAGLVEGRLLALLRGRRVVETGLSCGLALILAGAAGTVWSLAEWAGESALELRLRIFIGAVALSVLGVQTIFSGFLLSLFAIRADRR